MLEPIFFARVIEKKDSQGKPYFDIDQSPIPEGLRYRAMGYSRSGNYTLVYWELGNDEEVVMGETLWRGKTPVATSGGVVDIYEPPQDSRIVPATLSVWERINPNLGRYGIPIEVATDLRNPARRVPFQR